MDRGGAAKVSPTYQDVESAIAAVAGVAEASVRAAEGSTRGRLRIRLAAGHDPDLVSHEVAGVLRDRFGIDIDPASIRPKPVETTADAPEVRAGARAVAAPDAAEAPAADQAPATAAAPAPEVEASSDADAAADTDVEAVADTAVDADVPAAETAEVPVEEPVGETVDEPADETTDAPVAGAVEAGSEPVERQGLPGVDELFRPTAAGRQATVADGNGHTVVERRSFHRPLIRDLALGNRGLEIHAEVLLDLDGTEIRGRATGPATRRSTFRAIARATLDAVETMFPGDVKTELESIELLDDGEDERVTVSITFLTNDGADKLVGVSICRGDAEQAVMRATLDAVNRRVGLLLED